MPFCKNCGNKVSDQTKFCANCGFKLKDEEQKFEKIIEENLSSNTTNQEQIRPFITRQTDNKSNIKTDESPNSKFEKSPIQKLIIGSCLVLLLVNSIFAFYVIYNPGALYSPISSWPEYVHVQETWNFVFIVIVFDFILCLLKYKKLYLLFSFLLSIIYLVGLYIFPINYFSFTEGGHIVNDEALIYTISLIGFNLFSFFRYIFYLNHPNIDNKEDKYSQAGSKIKSYDNAGIR